MQVADFKKDGFDDLVTIEQRVAGTTLTVFPGKETGFGATIVSTIQPLADKDALDVADFDSDGKADVVVTDRANRRVSIYFGDSTGHFGSPTNVTVGNGPVGVTVGNFHQFDFTTRVKFSKDSGFRPGNITKFSSADTLNVRLQHVALDSMTTAIVKMMPTGGDSTKTGLNRQADGSYVGSVALSAFRGLVTVEITASGSDGAPIFTHRSRITVTTNSEVDD